MITHNKLSRFPGFDTRPRLFIAQRDCNTPTRLSTSDKNQPLKAQKVMQLEPSKDLTQDIKFLHALPAFLSPRTPSPTNL